MPRSTLTEKRYAVCIGINEYQPSAGLSSLRYAEGDAQAMDSLLGQLGFAAENRCLLVGQAATLEAVNDALSAIILDKAKKNDLVVFYFAGHSLPLAINEDEEQDEAERRSEVFLTTYDFDREKIKQFPSFRQRYALGMKRLRKDFFEGEGSRKRLFVFDSCYSGDFFGPGYRDEADPVQGYIKHMLESSSSGRVALSSCLPIQKAAEDPALGHGRFTYYLLKALSGEAVEALSRDGCLTVNDLFDYVAKQLPLEQRPVLSGVQQDTFELVCYKDKMVQLQLPALESEQTKQAEKVERLHAMIADHSSFMHDRLSSFVGREKELLEIRQRIAEKQQTGGYVTITGRAGEGKSSIIAKFVEEYGPENVAFHFIPFNPGPDHQVGLLRNLMARLILKYDLSDLYVASESRAALRDYFPKVLGGLVEKGGHEVIFVDGLDQLEAEHSGERDLSFLPNNPPKGVVFVLGTRPNDTLRPLELLKPRYEYQLPDLDREDFDLILQHRHVRLERGIGDRFYSAMQGNALYLDLLAKELAERGTTAPEVLIKQIADNPEHLFSLTIARMKRQPVEWREVIKPVLSVLLVAQEPLGLRHIRQILGAEDDRLRDGIERLGGLITRDWQQRYSLFHLKLYDYLLQDEQRPAKEYIFAIDEEQSWHNRLAQWCVDGDLSTIWQDVKHDSTEQGRCLYARQHYLAHLYYAHDWQRLFIVLDTATYGQAKIRDDPSTRAYTRDLDLGRQAAGRKELTVEEGIDLLPRLWQYTLLRCSLTSRADQYPLEAFRLLMLLGRKQEALGLAELLTEPARRMEAFLQIAKQLRELSGEEKEWLELFIRSFEIAQTIGGSTERVKALQELGTALVQAQQWERAEKLIRTIENNDKRVKALQELGTALVQAQQWERAEGVWAEAEAVIHTIENNDKRVKALRELGTALVQAQQWERAEGVWAEAERLIFTVENSYWQDKMLRELGMVLVQAQQWERAEELISMIKDSYWQAWALRELGMLLVQAQQWERAEGVWAEAEAVIRTIENNDKRVKALRELGTALVQAQQWERAEGVWAEAERLIFTVENSYERAWALQELRVTLVQAQRWKQAEKLIRTIENNDKRVKALQELGTALVQAQQWERAEGVWAEAEAVIHTIERGYVRAWNLQELGTALVQAQQWERAERLIRSSEESHWQDKMLRELGTALVQAQQWERAERLVPSIRDSYERARVLSIVGAGLVQAQQWEQAEGLWAEAERLIRSSEESHWQDKMLRELGTALVQAQQWKQAEELINMIENNDKRKKALRELGTALAQIQQWERAEDVIRRIENHSEQDRALQFLRTALEQTQQREQSGTLQEQVSTLIQAQQWNRAEELISSIENSDKSAKALQELGTALVQAQQWERAERLVPSIRDSYERAKALRELGTALAQAQQWNRASDVWVETEAVIRTIEDGIERARALRELGTVLAQTQQWEQADRLIHTIRDSAERVKALHGLWTALVQAQQWERAKVVIRRIQSSAERVKALHGLWTALVQAQQWKSATEVWKEVEAVIRMIKDRNEQSIVLRELVAKMAIAGQYKQLLFMIHRLWWLARTREDALQLFPIATGFIQLQPELGIAFYKAFTWVDDYFKK